MDLDTLAKLGEFVGGFFVVLSLVYLAHQVRMNTKSLRSENYARLLERMSTLQSRVAAEPDLNRVFTVGSEDPGRLTRSERIRYAWALYDMFGTAEFMFHQSRAKALPKGVWTRWEATIGWWFSHPGVRAWWAAKPSPLTADFEAFVTTDADVAPDTLRTVLQSGAADSFNAMTIDGCTSTNDTVLLLANGRAGEPDPDAFAAAVAEACFDLASQMVGDAEGHTKVVTVRVTGAASDDDARQAARKVAESQLVKCSWFGGDPYWGRVASDLGTAGVMLDPATLAIAYGGTVVSRGCVSVDHDAAAVAEHMAGEHLDLHCDLGVGDGAARGLTNDLTYGYIDENKGTS